ncbi:hypothetical protein IFR05_012675 [Cadophora sp. M221]|nr:hypothetical protein IFR05_012675 [Cadophora sp. M221]
MSNHQQQCESGNETGSACQLTSKQQSLQPPASQDSSSLNSQQAQFVAAEPDSQNGEYQDPSVNLGAGVLLNPSAYPTSSYHCQDWNQNTFPLPEATSSDPLHTTEQQLNVPDWGRWMYYGWYQDPAHISPEMYIENNLQDFDTTISICADPVVTPSEVPDLNIEIAGIDPEMYDEKNLHRFYGQIFIDDDPVIAPPKVPFPTIEPGLFATVPLKQITTNIPWKDTPEVVQRRRRLLDLVSSLNSPAPAPALEFSQQIPNTQPKDTTWRESEHEMTEMPVEDKEDKLASDEVLRRGVWPTSLSSLRVSRWIISCWAPGSLTAVCRREEEE